jgi:DNA-binding NtrC family response regulator
MNDTGKTRPQILLADDESLFGRTTTELLRRAGFDVTWVENGHDAMAETCRRPPDLMIVDLNMPGNLRLELLSECRERFPHIPMIVLTGRPTLPSAIESVRLGIHDYLLKPIEIEDLVHSVRRALPEKPLATEPASTDPDAILGKSEPVRKLKEMIRAVARTNANVLIRGESGTGKELIAQAIHRQSPRSRGPMVVVDCSAIPESLVESTLFGHVRGAFTGATSPRPGLIKSADMGTAFFDEIGELPLPMQAKLLRVIQFGTFLPVGANDEEKSDIRIVAATNRDLALEAERGAFRQDLYFRLAVLEIVVPPLRERSEDIAVLAESFLAEIAARDQTPVKMLGADALRALERYRWPGNIRELRNVTERCACLEPSDRISVESLPLSIRQTQSPEMANTNETKSEREPDRDRRLRAADREYLAGLMERNFGNVARAAREAGMSRQGLHKCLNRVGLDPKSYRR